MSKTVTLSSVSVIIPAYNDETTVDRLIKDTDALVREMASDYEIIVCNDGSKDGTLKVLRDLEPTMPNLRVIDHPINQGFGKTIRELYMAGKKDLIFSLPGDYQYAPKELVPMVGGLEKFDLIIGLRVKRNDPPRRRIQSHVYNFMLRAIHGIKYRDVNSIKLFRRTIMDKIELKSMTPFVDAELCIRADKAGFRVGEVGIEHLPRLSQGASGGKFSVIWETFSDLVKMKSTF